MQGKNILIVDDEIGPFAHELQSALERAGAEALIARDEKIAIQRLLNVDFDAVVLSKEHVTVLSRLIEDHMPVVTYGSADSVTTVFRALEAYDIKR